MLFSTTNQNNRRRTPGDLYLSVLPQSHPHNFGNPQNHDSTVITISNMLCLNGFSKNHLLLSILYEFGRVNEFRITKLERATSQ